MTVTSTLSVPASSTVPLSQKQIPRQPYSSASDQSYPAGYIPKQQVTFPIGLHTDQPQDFSHLPQGGAPSQLRPSDRAPYFGTAPTLTSLPLSSIPDADESKTPSPATTPRQNLNYPLPLSPSQSLAVIAVMQERQESWGRAARSSSSASAASSPGSSTSPNTRSLPGMELTVQTRLAHPTDGKTGGKSGKPRKKVAKACLACQRSHLTCDEKRPCTRCTKKGIADQCVEGVRKKAKYLLEGDERGANDPPSSSHHAGPSNPSQSTSPLTHQSSQPIHSIPQPQLQSIPQQSTSAMSQLPNLLPDQPTQPHVPGDVWLSAPLAGMDDTNMGLDSRQIWGDGQGNASNPGIKEEGRGSDTMFSLGPTAAADEFHMFDAMFGNMSPVFPFDTTPGSNDNDLFGLNAMNNNTASGLNTTVNDGFNMNWTSDMGNQQTGTGQDVSTFPNTGNNAERSLDANSVWTSWTNNNQPANNPGLQSNQVNINPLSNASTSGISPLSNLSVPNTTPLSQNTVSRSNSVPAGNSTTPVNATAQQHRQSQPDLSGLHQGMGQLHPPLSIPVTNAQNGTSKAMSGGANDVQPIGTGPFALSQAGAAGHGAAFRNNRATPSEVYRSVVKPYDYTEGYHILMQYLTTNFEQRDVLRVVHSLAAYRPSLIALQMPMSEEDEVFLERSFQRTLIELEKLISYSATPTAVWRRTGEVCYANPEFCRLVGRSEADLCAKKSYIYHIFDRSSVIAYWENFSNHAFENTTQNFFQPTMLQVGVEAASPDPVKCSACYTIRRDVFDLPSVIIGQFLPIPSDLL